MEICIQANTENIVTCIYTSHPIILIPSFTQNKLKQKTYLDPEEGDRLHLQVTTNKKHHT